MRWAPRHTAPIVGRIFVLLSHISRSNERAIEQLFAQLYQCSEDVQGTEAPLVDEKACHFTGIAPVCRGKLDLIRLFFSNSISYR
jgi:hypothetical protein